MYAVYYIDNTVNDKIYVGLTSITPEARFLTHCESRNTSNSLIAKSIRKHGKDRFSVHTLGEYDTREEMDNAERLWIILLKTYDRKIGYNQTYGGGSNFTMTPEVKQHLSDRRQEEGHNWTGKKHSEESKLRTSQSMSGKTRPQEVKDKIGNFFRGKKQTPEFIERRAVSIRAFWARQREQKALEDIFA